MSEPTKPPTKPLKSRFTFRVKNPDGRSSSTNVVEYLFDDKAIGREDWVALQQHMFLKAVGNEASEDSHSLFERIFGKGVGMP